MNLPALDMTVTQRLTDIFHQQGWIIEDNRGKKISLFNKFCNLLKKLDAQERDLLLDLTDKFMKVGQPTYLSMAYELLEDIHQSDKLLSSIKRVFIMPLIAPADRDREQLKSSMFMSYLLAGVDFSDNDLFIGKKRYLVSNPDRLLEEPDFGSPASILITVDDFIGSGKTACDALEDILGRGIRRDKVMVVGLVAQQEGLDRINRLGVKTYCSKVREKGISSSYPPEEVPNKLEIMNSIEHKIGVQPDYHFGYGQSEALVSMHRTPNNTFPVFWYNRDRTAIPFPRSIK